MTKTLILKRPNLYHNGADRIALDLVRQASVKIGTIQRRLAWYLRKDDTLKSRWYRSLFTTQRERRIAL